MLTIWKFSIPDGRNFTIDMPQGAKVLNIDLLDGKPYLWAFVNTELPLETRTFGLILTGDEIINEDDKDLNMIYIKTVIKEYRSDLYPDQKPNVEVWHFVEIFQKQPVEPVDKSQVM